MSAELYDRFAKITRIDQAIFEAEKEVENGNQPLDTKEAFERLDKKYYQGQDL